MSRLFRLFLVLCLFLAQGLPATWARSSAGHAPLTTQGEAMGNAMGDAEMACCAHEAPMPCDLCAIDACSAHCAGLGLPGVSVAMRLSHGDAVLVSGREPAPKPAPVFREERPPRRPV